MKMMLYLVFVVFLCRSVICKPAPTATKLAPTTATYTANQTTTSPLSRTSKPDTTWTCPEPPIACECPDEEQNECTVDQDCKNNLMCCRDGCDLRCVHPDPVVVTPSTKKMGVCPIFPHVSADECPVEPNDECEVDQQCAHLNSPDEELSYKCCLDGCDKRCVPSVPPTTKPSTPPTPSPKMIGICSPFPPDDGCQWQENFCTADQDCEQLNSPDETYKCCQDGCYKLCAPAIMIPVATPSTQSTKTAPSSPLIPSTPSTPPTPSTPLINQKDPILAN